MDIREKLESHLKEKLQEMGSRGSLVHPGKRHISRIDKSRSLEAEIAEDYQRISEAMSCSTESIKTRVLVHRDPQMYVFRLMNQEIRFSQIKFMNLFE